MSQPILPLEIQLLAIAILVAFSGWVISLIRTQRLQLRESLMWLLSTLAAMLVTAFPELLVRAAMLLGVQVPSNALFAAALLYLAVNVLAVTIGVSGNTARVRRLAQECALLRAEIEELRAAAGRAPPRPDAPQPAARR